MSFASLSFKTPFKHALIFLWLSGMLSWSVLHAFQAPEDQGQGPALSPQESFSKFRVSQGYQLTPLLSDPQISQPLSTTYDAQGRLWVVQYLQYPDPAGLKRVSRDNFWRTVYDSIPLPPGHGGVRGADKITVHEDRDGDGRLETETTFVDGLNIATSVVPTRDGAWVLNPPYLLFYADKNHDLKADGVPEVHLEGFGLEDTHSVVNSLCLGPDGWLYAAQGSTVSGAVRRYGSAEPPHKSMGQAIWRYHPVLKQYEIFAEGGGNAFSVAFDDHGDVFSGHNGGDTRGFHYRQEAYYRKGFNKHGSLSNPNSFGYLMPMRHAPIQRFTHAMMMTGGTVFEKRMPHSMLAVDPLHGKLIQTQLLKSGSTFETKDIEDTVASDDKWFRPVAINDGPDGSATICDWYDFQVAHLYAHVGKMDRDHGRVYRLSPIEKERNPTATAWDNKLAIGVDQASLNALVEKMQHPYRWQRWKARELLASHPLKEKLFHLVVEELNRDTPHVLDWLWLAHACGWIDDTIPYQNGRFVSIDLLVKHPNPDIRAWAVRLACDDHTINSETATAIRWLASTEDDVGVLCQIASSAKRLPGKDALPIISQMIVRPLPADDVSLPIMIWWAVEKHSKEPATLRAQLPWNALLQYPIGRQKVAANLIEVWAKLGTPASMQSVAQTLADIQKLSESSRQDATLHATEAFERAFQNRSLLGVPDNVINALVSLGRPTLTLQLRRGDASAKEQATKVLVDATVPLERRIQVAQLIGELGHSEQIPTLLDLAKDSKTPERMREAAIAALSLFDQPIVGATLLELWPGLSTNLKGVAGSAIASRRAWTQDWVNACTKQKVDPKSMPMECIRAMRMHSEESLQKMLKQVYPDVQGTNLVETQSQVAKLLERIQPLEADPYRGKAQFKALCARCHLLFAEGGEIGPDLTGYQRDQLPTLMRNIIAPSLEIREGYQTVGVLLADGTVLTGYIESQQSDHIVVRGTDGKSHVIQRSEIDEMKPQSQSLMPDGILDSLDDQKIADLFAYLRSSQPLSD